MCASLFHGELCIDAVQLSLLSMVSVLGFGAFIQGQFFVLDFIDKLLYSLALFLVQNNSTGICNWLCFRLSRQIISHQTGNARMHRVQCLLQKDLPRFLIEAILYYAFTKRS